MKKLNKVEREINAIRVDFYEKTKGMSPSEMNAYIKKSAEHINKKHGLSTKGKPYSEDQRAPL